MICAVPASALAGCGAPSTPTVTPLASVTSPSPTMVTAANAASATAPVATVARTAEPPEPTATIFPQPQVPEVMHYRELVRLGTGAIRNIARDPRGELVAAATSAGVMLFSATGLTLERTLAENRPFETVSWSPDGNWLALGGNPTGVLVWNRTADQPSQIDFAEGIELEELAWSPSGDLLAVASMNGLFLWNPTNRSITAHEEMASLSLAWSPDGQYLALGKAEYNPLEVYAIHHPNQAPVARIDARGPVSSIAWSPDGDSLLVGIGEPWAIELQESATIQLWTLGQQPILRESYAVPSWANSVVWLSHRHAIAAALNNGDVWIWPEGADEPIVLNTLSPAVVSIADAAADDQLLTGGSDGVLELWNWEKQAVIAQSTSQMVNVPAASAVRWSPSGRLLLIACRNGEIQVWDAVSWTQVNVISAHTGGVLDATWSPDGTRIATSGEDGRAVIWNSQDLSIVAELDDDEGRIPRIAWNPIESSLLAVGSLDTIGFWDTERETLLRTISSSPVSSMNWSPDGRLLAVGPDADSLFVLDGRTYQRVAINSSFYSTMKDLAWAPDNKRIVMGGGFGATAQAYSWLPETDPIPVEIEGLSDMVTSVAWAPNGMWWAIGTRDGHLSIWNAKERRHLTDLVGYQDWITSIQWNSAATLLASSSEDGTIRIWGIP